jgi:hypothetical protein
MTARPGIGPPVSGRTSSPTSTLWPSVSSRWPVRRRSSIGRSSAFTQIRAASGAIERPIATGNMTAVPNPHDTR